LALNDGGAMRCSSTRCKPTTFQTIVKEKSNAAAVWMKYGQEDQDKRQAKSA